MVNDFYYVHKKLCIICNCIYICPQVGLSLDELDKEDLFIWLLHEVDEETAHAVQHNGLSGSDLLDLSDDELKEVVCKIGPRIKLKKLIKTFKGVDTTQSNVRPNENPHYT